MLNYIPVIGWIISFALSFFVAIPFYFLWNHLAPTYFYYVPKVFQSIPFWDCVWLWMIAGMLKMLLIPKLASFSQTNKSGD